MHKSLLKTIGNTPLVKVDFGTPPQIYAKLEYFNPGGSIKDRSALYMIEKAEKEEIIKPGGTLIEASSGNQGIAIAMIGAIMGYNVIITVAEKVSKEKKGTLEAYGAKLVVCKTVDFLEDPESYHSVAMRIHKETPNSLMINQYFNPDNPEAHYTTLGPEIWNQTEGKITHLCGGVGTGGTICGAGKFLKEKNPKIGVVGVDAFCSFRSTGGNPKPYVAEGMGVDFDCPHIQNDVIDQFIPVNDAETISMLKELSKQHGLLVGPASGATAYAVREYSKNLSPDDLLVMIFGDSGRAYLTKNFY